MLGNNLVLSDVVSLRPATKSAFYFGIKLKTIYRLGNQGESHNIVRE